MLPVLLVTGLHANCMFTLNEFRGLCEVKRNV
jgi:hypothetical protein